MEILKDGETPWTSRPDMARMIKARLRQMAKRIRAPRVAIINARKPSVEVRELDGAAGELGIRAYTVNKATSVAIGSKPVSPTMAVSLSYLSIQGGEQ